MLASQEGEEVEVCKLNEQHKYREDKISTGEKQEKNKECEQLKETTKLTVRASFLATKLLQVHKYTVTNFVSVT